MKSKLLEEFISFAKENYGISITAVKGDNPDTFEYIFGGCFGNTDFEQDTMFYSAKEEYQNYKLPDTTFTSNFAEDSEAA